MLATAAVLASKIATAGSSCTFDVTPGEGLAPRWSEAVRSVEATTSAPASDCRVVSLSIDRSGATLTLTTLDGRHAVRHVAQPEELAPLVKALLVTLPDDIPPSPSETTAETAPAPVAEPRDVVDADEHPRKVDDESRPVTPIVGTMGLGLGVDGDSHHDDAEPYGQAMIAVQLEHWELGAFGRWDFEHGVGRTAAGRKMEAGAAGAGLAVARREHVGPTTLVIGATAAVYAAWQALGRLEIEQTAGSERAPRYRDSIVDPRFGLYAATVVPVSKRFRLRAQIDGVVAPAPREPSRADLQPLAAWNVGFALGAETVLLP
ncbi:hypothetical protein AKJ09_07144 [Labilithrix luteola]|uniref:Uncharacterized protein n=1 Tax=Labilithrix luteola TaxID=1391654 RepID=A0A0K1Q3S0_9BACT|nr:hypothetical protein [Labilithrix luteola]AKV00481.1 hypothetical protein AKJ09_07144 [Labilithrix luteola]